MNNKQIGMNFERYMCDVLARRGWWVHFLSPDARGAQPFDIIAVRDGQAIAIDCKTCKDHVFRIGRLEDNQVLAFDLWQEKGKALAWVAILHDSKVYMVRYDEIKKNGKVDLRKKEAFIDGDVLCQG